MANINRGEQDIEIDGNTYTLVLTLEDVNSLENVLEMGMEDLLTKLREATARTGHVNAVFQRALSKAKPRLTKKEVDELLPRVPYLERRIKVASLILGALSYLDEQQPQKEEEDVEPVKPKEEEKNPLSSTTDE